MPRMIATDSVSGNKATCFITIDGRRLNFMNMTEFESKWEVTIVEVPILGKPGPGHKTVGGKGTWSGTAHFNQSHLRAVMDTYQKTGVLPYFEIHVTNEDPASRAGRQTIIHHDCLLDGVTLAKFEVGQNTLNEELSGTFESWDIPEKFRELEGM